MLIANIIGTQTNAYGLMYSPVLSLPMLQRLARLAQEAVAAEDGEILANYKPPPSKNAKTSESEKEKSRKYENEKRKRAYLKSIMEKMFCVARIPGYER